MPDVGIEQWWPKLQPATREWLIANNGDAVPTDIVVEITQAGGSFATAAWSAGARGRSELFLSVEQTDWIEAVANGETPVSL